MTLKGALPQTLPWSSLTLSESQAPLAASAARSARRSLRAFKGEQKTSEVRAHSLHWAIFTLPR